MKTTPLVAVLLAAASLACEAGVLEGQFRGTGASSSSSVPATTSTINGTVRIKETNGRVVEVTITKTKADSNGDLAVTTEHYYLSDRGFGGTLDRTSTSGGLTTRSVTAEGGRARSSVRRAGSGRVDLILTKPDKYVSGTYSETGSEVVKIRIDLNRHRTSYSVTNGFRGSDGSYGTNTQRANGRATGRID
jgi:hypothetical protein